jgi:histidinol-phosphatase
MTETVPAALVAFAGELADASGAVIRRYFRQSIEIVTKPDRSPVTIADREAESAIRALVAARYPAHGVIGEEHDDHQTDAEWVWVLDPIDGTKGFISGRPLFGTLIALCREGRPVLGVIDHPAIGERWIGAHGHPARFNGREVHVRRCAELGQASLFASSPHMFHGPAAPAFERLRGRCRQVLYGSDCYHYGIVASGFGDLVAESNMGIYDYLAGAAVIEAAGGVASDWQGRPLTIASGDQVLAAGDRRMLEAALKLLA